MAGLSLYAYGRHKRLQVVQSWIHRTQRWCVHTMCCRQVQACHWLCAVHGLRSKFRRARGERGRIRLHLQCWVHRTRRRAVHAVCRRNVQSSSGRCVLRTMHCQSKFAHWQHERNRLCVCTSVDSTRAMYRGWLCARHRIFTMLASSRGPRGLYRSICL